MPSRVQRIQYRIESLLTYGLIVGLLFGLVVGLTTALFIPFSAESAHIAMEERWYVGMLIDSLTSGLIAGLIAGFLQDIQPVETLKWSAKEAEKVLRISLITGIISSLFVVLVFQMIARLFFNLSLHFHNSPKAVLSGLMLGLIFGLSCGLISGLKGPSINSSHSPNQGIYSSLRNAWISAVIFGTLLGPIVGLSASLLPIALGTNTYELEKLLGTVLHMSLSTGLIASLVSGATASLRHFSLRLLLYRLGYVSWNYARFLDYATERLFLQKVGGGYIFIHRMLLEHFAQMELSPKSPK